GQVGAVARRHDQRDLGAAGAEVLLDLGVAADLAEEIVEAGRGHALREGAAGGRAVLIPDHGRHVADVVVDGVAEEEELHDRQREHHAHGQPVAAELHELLPGDGEKAVHEGLLSSSWTMATNASSTPRRASCSARTWMPCRRSTGSATSFGSAPPLHVTRSSWP